MMRNLAIVLLLSLIAALVVGDVGCSYEEEDTAPTSAPTPTPGKYAGWRSSYYGYQYEEEPSYWVHVANQMSSKFSGFVPGGIWILGVSQGTDCYLPFPNPDGNSYPGVIFDSEDKSEEYLDAFDSVGLRVWLQVEPANANVEQLIDLVLNKYKHHPSVIGFGIDVEWLYSTDSQQGRPVTNNEAQSWLNKIESHNLNYKLFLKHWEENMMPPTYRHEDIVFINDDQDASNLDDLVSEFETWGNYFSESEVGFQYGYEADRDWWNDLSDPSGDIGNEILTKIPNTTGLYWVDFTITDIFPPTPAPTQT